MLKLAMLGLLVLAVGSTSFGDCDNCDLNETCIDKVCFPKCRDMWGTGSCECFGDICFDKAWCNGNSKVCCRTCKNNWTILIAIVLGFLVSITLAVVYGQFCTSGNSELLDESEIGQHKIRVEKSSFPLTLSDSWSSCEYAIPIPSVENSYTRNLPIILKQSQEIHVKPSLIHGIYNKTVPNLLSLDETKAKNFGEFKSFSLVQNQTVCKDDISSCKMSGSQLEDLSYLSSKYMSDASSQTHQKLHYDSCAQSRRNMSAMSLSHTRQKSNWDCFFETRTSLPSSQQTNKTSVKNNESSQDWTDSHSAQIELSQQELNADKLRKEDVKHLENSGSGNFTCLENLSSENFRKKGEVLLSYHSKGGVRFTMVPLNTHLDDIAAWLNKGSQFSIPISLNNHPKLMEIKRQKKSSKKTLSDIFGGELNTEKEGITIFIGPVEGKLSFKMSKCDLNLLQMMTRDSKASKIDIIHS